MISQKYIQSTVTGTYCVWREMAKNPIHFGRLVIHHFYSHLKEIIGETAELLLTQVWARLKEISRNWGGKNKKEVLLPLLAWKGQEEGTVIKTPRKQ